jgi:hypothetical protein
MHPPSATSSPPCSARTSIFPKSRYASIVSCASASPAIRASVCRISLAARLLFDERAPGPPPKGARRI